MTKTIITGASGFIGNKLLQAIDSDRSGITHSIEHQDITFGHSYNANKLFFLSTYGNMAHHKSSEKMIQANIWDLLTVVKHFNGWFCYMSSSSVTLPVQTPYSRTKRAAEEILQALPELKSCIVRPYSVTGVGEQKEHLIPTLIRSCMEGEEIPFDPSPVHDFVDVSDICDALVSLSNEKATGIVELGSGACYSNLQVLDMVQAVCGRKANIKASASLRPYDNANWFCKSPHPSFTPRKSLEQSISEMVAEYRHES